MGGGHGGAQSILETPVLFLAIVFSFFLVVTLGFEFVRGLCWGRAGEQRERERARPAAVARAFPCIPQSCRVGRALGSWGWRRAPSQLPLGGWAGRPRSRGGGIRVRGGAAPPPPPRSFLFLFFFRRHPRAPPRPRPPLACTHTPAHPLTVVPLPQVIHHARHFLLARKKAGLVAALDTMTTEIMLLGVATLFLSVIERSVGGVCVPAKDLGFAVWADFVKGCSCCLPATAGLTTCFLRDRGCVSAAALSDCCAHLPGGGPGSAAAHLRGLTCPVASLAGVAWLAGQPVKRGGEGRGEGGGGVAVAGEKGAG